MFVARNDRYDAVPVRDGAVVLVHSAASGVGRMLTQLVTGRGGRVIATVSRAHKARPAAEAGAWQVLVRDETGGPRRGDPGPHRRRRRGHRVRRNRQGALRRQHLSAALQGRLRALRPRRRAYPPLDLWDQPDGVHLVHRRGDAGYESIDQWRRRASQVMQWIEDGTLDVWIDRRYPLNDAAEAHRDIESGKPVAKLLLLPGPRFSDGPSLAAITTPGHG